MHNALPCGVREGSSPLCATRCFTQTDITALMNEVKGTLNGCFHNQVGQMDLVFSLVSLPFHTAYRGKSSYHKEPSHASAVTPEQRRKQRCPATTSRPTRQTSDPHHPISLNATSS
uniref:Uncharacterized protein n=1 Tax=Parascaris univalens TaxID=6257 RepID=A0A915A338_PARUN